MSNAFFSVTPPAIITVAPLTIKNIITRVRDKKRPKKVESAA